MSSTTSLPLRIGGARIDAQNVELRPGLVLDEVRVEGDALVVIPPSEPGESPGITCEATRFRAVMSEQNLNRLIESVLPPDGFVKDVRVAVMSGRIRLSLQTARLLTLSLSLEAVPRIENGVRVVLDWQAVTFAGIPVPHQIVEVLEEKINKALDLSKSPVPVWLDEIRCEPGRLTGSGKAQLEWPLVLREPTPGPFTARDLVAEIDRAPADSALPTTESASEQAPT